MSETSKFRRFSIGTVLTDLMPGSKTINILPHEVIADFDGDLESIDTVNKQITNSTGDTFDVKLEVGKAITATWYNPNSNRVTPPNVRKGEKVEIYQFGDAKKYYWKTMGNELDLRRLEDVVYVFVNARAEGIDTIDDSNSYTFNISTLNKMIKLQTADNDGELTTYKLYIDTKEGQVVLEDGRGNKVGLDSATDTFKIKTNNEVNIEAANVVNVSAVTINLIAGTTANVSASTVNVNASKVNIN